MPLLSLVGLAALALIWGTQYLVIRVGLQTAPPLLTASLRFAILALAAGAIAGARRATAPRGTRGARLAMGLTHAASMALLYWAQARVPSSLAAALVLTEPLFVTLLAHRWVPGEALRARLLVAHLLGFGGVLLILSEGLRGGLGGEGLALLGLLLAAICGAGNKVIAKRLTAGADPFLLARDVGVTVCLVTGAGWAACESQLPLGIDARAAAAFVYLGLVASTAASALYLTLLRRHRVGALAYLQFVTALVAVGAGVLLGGERPPATALAGALLVAAGLLAIATQRGAAPPPAA